MCPADRVEKDVKTLCSISGNLKKKKFLKGILELKNLKVFF